MALVASDVIRAARDAHPAFTPGRIAPPVAWRALLRIYTPLVGQVARTTPDVLTASSVQATLPLASYASGIALGSALLQPLDASALDSAGRPSSVELVPYNARAGTIRHPAATILGQTCFLLGEEAWWSQWASVVVRFIPQPALTLNEVTTLALPDDAFDCLTAKLAAAFATRIVGSGQPAVENAGQLLSDGDTAERLFLERIGAWKRGQTFRVREVF